MELYVENNTDEGFEITVSENGGSIDAEFEEYFSPTVIERVQSDWAETDTESRRFILHKPNISSDFDAIQDSVIDDIARNGWV